MPKTFKLISVFVLLLLAAAASAQTQPTSQRAFANPNAVTESLSPASQALASSLSNLPDADVLVFVNPRRVLTELIPKIAPPKDVAEMQKGFEQARTMAGVDPTKIDYIVFAVRFRKPTTELNFQPPEALVTASGDFSAESLMTLARMASQGKLRDEKYGNKTMGLMTIDPLVKEAEKNPMLRGFTEIAVVPLTASSIAAGTPGYLRAAIDANDGKDRISPEILNALVRDPNVLISVAGRPWHSFAKSFGMLGTETNARTSRCDTKLGDFYAALTMDATNFMLRGVINEDNPDTAKIVNNLISGLLGYATASIKDPMAQSMLKNLTLTAEGDEIIVRADFPQQAVMDFIKQQMQPKKAEATSTAPVKKPVRRTRRRRG